MMSYVVVDWIVEAWMKLNGFFEGLEPMDTCMFVPSWEGTCLIKLGEWFIILELFSSIGFLLATRDWMGKKSYISSPWSSSSRFISPNEMDLGRLCFETSKPLSALHPSWRINKGEPK